MRQYASCKIRSSPRAQSEEKARDSRVLMIGPARPEIVCRFCLPPLDHCALGKATNILDCIGGQLSAASGKVKVQDKKGPRRVHHHIAAPNSTRQGLITRLEL